MAFAVSDAHAAARGSLAPLSVEHLYYHAVQRTPGRDPDDGVALGTILSALRLDGQCLETGWPYLAALPADRKAWTPPAAVLPIHKRGAAAVGPKVAKLIEQLDGGSPVVLTLLLGERFYHPIGEFVTTGPDDPDTDYHAVIAVGHGLRVDASFVLVRNSWGYDWGENGHAWIAADYLETRLDGAATLLKTETV